MKKQLNNLPSHIHQHTIPKCYLKNFLDNNKNLYHWIKVSNIIRLIPLSSATVVDDFYTMKNCKDPMMIETLFYDREVENYYNKYYKMLTDPTIMKIPTMVDLSRILMCLLSLHCRTPKQFKIFLDMIPVEHNYEMNKIKDDYKAAHVEILTKFIESHQFKTIRIIKIIDGSEFITSDNPILIIDNNYRLQNDNFHEQFNSNHKIIIPIDKKHCCVLTNLINKNDDVIKIFSDNIDRCQATCSFTQNVNFLMVQSSDKYCFGSKKYLEGFFGLFKFLF